MKVSNLFKILRGILIAIAPVLFITLCYYLYCFYLGTLFASGVVNAAKEINTALNHREKLYYTVFDSRLYDNYKIYFADKDRDTLAFIVDVRQLKECQSFTTIDKALLKQVDNLGQGYKEFVTTDGDTLSFQFRLWDVNHRLHIYTGDQMPGRQSEKIVVFTYNSLPYLIDDCDALK